MVETDRISLAPHDILFSDLNSRFGNPSRTEPGNQRSSNRKGTDTNKQTKLGQTHV